MTNRPHRPDRDLKIDALRHAPDGDSDLRPSVRRVVGASTGGGCNGWLYFTACAFFDATILQNYGSQSIQANLLARKVVIETAPSTRPERSIQLDSGRQHPAIANVNQAIRTPPPISETVGQ
jgi:hypothetical protein